MIRTRSRTFFAIVSLTINLAFANLCTVKESAAQAPRADGAKSGYIGKGDHIDVAAILPHPPAANSKAQYADEFLSQQYLQLIDTPRWEQATIDAKIRYPNHASAFSCASGVRLTNDNTPITNSILFRAMIDVGRTVQPIKKMYQRPRPFMLNQQPVCTPTGTSYLAKDGSYPSGHAATGWAWALILAEISSPEATARILARGWEFGQSRAICNVHWQSDVDQGRALGAMLVAQLHEYPDFRIDLSAAREELAAVVTESEFPDLDCSRETAALMEVPGVP